MKKYFHELTENEFKDIVASKITYGQLAEDYPKPEWCNYPEATCGAMGCWSLTNHMVTGREYCKDCEMSKDYKSVEPQKG